MRYTMRQPLRSTTAITALTATAATKARNAVPLSRSSLLTTATKMTTSTTKHFDSRRHRRRCLSTSVVVFAAATPPDSGSGAGDDVPTFSLSNPFRSKKKEEDAKNLLKGMFEGKGDPLSIYDNGGPGYKGKKEYGGSGGGSGGSGGGGGGGGGDGDESNSGSSGPLSFLKHLDPRSFVLSFLSSLGTKAKGALKVVGAILAFASLFVAVPLAKPAAVGSAKLVNWALRLDAANPRSRFARRSRERKEAILRAEAEAQASVVGGGGGGGTSSSASGSAPSAMLLGANEVEALARYGPSDLDHVIEAAAEAARKAAAEESSASSKKGGSASSENKKMRR